MVPQGGSIAGHTEACRVHCSIPRLSQHALNQRVCFALGFKNRLAAAITARNLPVLIIHGNSDKLVPLSNSLRLARGLPGCELAVMDKTGGAENLDTLMSAITYIENVHLAHTIDMFASVLCGCVEAALDVLARHGRFTWPISCFVAVPSSLIPSVSSPVVVAHGMHDEQFGEG